MNLFYEKVKCYGHLLSLRVDVETKLEESSDKLSDERKEKLQETIDNLNHIMYVMNELFQTAELTNLESTQTSRASLELTVENNRLKRENDLMREQIKEWMI